METDSYTEQLRKTHKEKPLAFFEELLTNLWLGRSEAETMKEWERTCTRAPWYAEDSLACFAHILAAPPVHLADLMQNKAAILLDHGPHTYTDLTQYRTSYLDFLQSAVDRFRIEFEKSNS